jgi:hypothetical protein
VVTEPSLNGRILNLLIDQHNPSSASVGDGRTDISQDPIFGGNHLDYPEITDELGMCSTMTPSRYLGWEEQGWVRSGLYMKYLIADRSITSSSKLHSKTICISLTASTPEAQFQMASETVLNTSSFADVGLCKGYRAKQLPKDNLSSASVSCF